MSAILYSIVNKPSNLARAFVTSEKCYPRDRTPVFRHPWTKEVPILVCSACIEYSDTLAGLAGALVSDCTQAETGQCEICLADFI